MVKVSFRTEGNKSIFSCGCVSELIGKNFVLTPCSPDCEIFHFVSNNLTGDEKIQLIMSQREDS